MSSGIPLGISASQVRNARGPPIPFGSDAQQVSGMDLEMIAVVLLVLILVFLAATPWRRLPTPGRIWAAGALLNSLVFFGMPTTAATSPWRPVVGWVLAGSAVA